MPNFDKDVQNYGYVSNVSLLRSARKWFAYRGKTALVCGQNEQAISPFFRQRGKYLKIGGIFLGLLDFVFEKYSEKICHLDTPHRIFRFLFSSSLTLCQLCDFVFTITVSFKC